MASNAAIHERNKVTRQVSPDRVVAGAKFSRDNFRQGLALFFECCNLVADLLFHCIGRAVWRQMFAEFSHGKIGIAVVDLATPIKEEFRQPESARSWMALWTFFVANPDGIGAR